MDSLYTHKVQYYETDKMGIVHHSNYIRFFEEARTHYFEQWGIGYDKIEEMGIIVPVLGVECKFKNTCTYGDNIEIELKLLEFNGIKFTFGYTISSENGNKIHVTGKTQHCFLDSNFKPVIVKKSHPELYAFITNMMEKTPNL